jgi:glycosyltransferase involved in cell wall biosynthesis
MAIKILFDSDIFDRQKFGGISWYFTEVIKNLKTKANTKTILPVVLTENLVLQDKKLTNKLINRLFYTKYTPQILIKKAPPRLNTTLTRYYLKQQNFDVFVPTYFDIDFLKYIGNKPFVLTVYDMLHEILPHYYLDDKHTVPQKLTLMEQATRIIAISENTKKDIVKIYPHIDANKIDVVHLAQSLEIDEKVKIDLPKKYILFVGYRMTYKNFIFLFNAAKTLLKTDPDLYLVCAGGYAFKPEEIELFKNEGLSDKIIHKTFEVNELFYFYQNAQCFIFPSQYEGFGIPVLEAMACGCPVILPRYSSFPEVAGEAGIYFELNDEKGLEDNLKKVLENEDFRKAYITKGYAQSGKFTWKKTADECFEIFQKAVQNEY